MGNNASRPHASGGGASSGSSTSTPSGTTPGIGAGATPLTATSHATRREPRRRDSVQPLPSGKATAAPPSESHESATAQTNTTPPSTASSAQHSAQSLPVRPRSRTIELPPSDNHSVSAEGRMGNEQSRPRPTEAFDPKPFNPSRPMDVPSSGEVASRSDKERPAVGAPPEQYHIAPPQHQTHRPPRLPLPIEQEVHTPGSPIISPADLSAALDQDIDLEHGLDASIPRRSSVLSSTTIDEDDIGDELHAYSVDGEMRKTIPTQVEWRQGGEKVYVTGTFASWNRKFRLHKDNDHLSAIIQLPPGTHHLKFIVDGEMRTSDHMPTAVDYTNILVNYLEVSAEDAAAAAAAGAAVTPTDQAADPLAAAGVTADQHANLHPPLVLPPPSQPTPSASTAAPTSTSPTPAPPSRPKRWTSQTPQYLLDLDQPEDSPAYQRASAAIASLPPPPSLPLFLNKSILNGNTPMKDDSSVLNMPNHTVLNHLATSSIRSGVLATSATTRYKKKHVTTILYKPTQEEDD